MSRTLTNPLSSFKPQLLSYGLPAFRANQPIAKTLPGVRYKCYAVARGRAPGIYLTPEEAITQTKNYANSCMRKFSDRLQADRWLLAHSAHQQQLDWATQSWYGKIVTGMEKGKNGKQIELQLIPRVEWKKVKCEMITKEG